MKLLNITLVDEPQRRDIPEVAAAFAPRRLVSLTKLPEPFGTTQRIYRLQRASNQLLPAGSLPEALSVWDVPRNPR